MHKQLRCWHCGLDQVDPNPPDCPNCHQPLCPDPNQREAARAGIHYLIGEIRRWTSVPNSWKSEAEAAYQTRLSRLSTLGDEGWWVELSPPPAKPPSPSLPSQPGEASVAWQMLADSFSEKKVHLLYALGGVLLLAAGVGILRSSWEGWGRQAVALLMTLAPLLFFWLAGRFQQVLPTSSRMFYGLGGGMLPIGLLFLNSFKVAGLHLPSPLWNPLAFLLGWLVNHALARTREPFCAYLAGLCWALAGWASGSGLALGLFCFGGALALFHYERNPHFTRVAHLLSGLGLLAAFTRGPLETGSAAALFLLAIVYFTTRSLFLTSPSALLFTSVISLLCAGWFSHLLDWPQSSIGLAALLQGALYIRRGPAGERVAIYLTGAVLLLFLGLPLAYQLTQNFANVPTSQLLTGCLTGVLASLYYSLCAHRQARPAWVYGASGSALYAYFMLLAMFIKEQPALYRPSLLVMALIWQVSVALARRKVSPDYLQPWAFTAAGMALLLLPLNLVMHLAGADDYTAWTYLGVAAVTTLSALLEHDPRALYLSCVTAALAYASWLPVLFGSSREPNLGLAFSAFVAALALLGLGLRRQPQSQPYAAPLLQMAALAAWGFSSLQLFYLSLGYWQSARVALILYGVGFALARQRASNFQAGVCLLTALASLDQFGPLGVCLALVGSGALMFSGPSGYREAAFLSSAACLLVAPAPLRILPPLLWLLASAYSPHLDPKRRTSLAQLSSGLLLLALPGSHTPLTQLGMALFCLGQLLLAVRWNQANLLVLSWIGAKLCLLSSSGGWQPEWMTLILWTELPLLVWANRKMTSPVILLEAMTAFGILAFSSSLTGAWGILSPWALTLALLVRSRQSGQQLLAGCAQGSAIWASFRCASLAQTPLLFATLQFAWSYLCLALQQPTHFRLASAVGWLGCLAPAGLLERITALALGAGAWAWASRQDKTHLWGVFGLLYHAYLSLLISAHITTYELYLLPIAGWFLLWGHRYSQQAIYRQIGLLLTLAPSLVLSLFSYSSALWAGSLALLLVLAGHSGRQGAYQAWGALALLTEITLQTVWVARNLPWHIWAVGAGILVVSLAFLADRRRQQMTQASRHFVTQLQSWQ